MEIVAVLPIRAASVLRETVDVVAAPLPCLPAVTAALASRLATWRFTSAAIVALVAASESNCLAESPQLLKL